MISWWSSRNFILIVLLIELALIKISLIFAIRLALAPISTLNFICIILDQILSRGLLNGFFTFLFVVLIYFSSLATFLSQVRLLDSLPFLFKEASFSFKICKAGIFFHIIFTILIRLYEERPIPNLCIDLNHLVLIISNLFFLLSLKLLNSREHLLS